MGLRCAHRKRSVRGNWEIFKNVDIDEVVLERKLESMQSEQSEG